MPSHSHPAVFQVPLNNCWPLKQGWLLFHSGALKHAGRTVKQSQAQDFEAGCSHS